VTPGGLRTCFPHALPLEPSRCALACRPLRAFGRIAVVVVLDADAGLGWITFGKATR